jgi:hypothetical protein
VIERTANRRTIHGQRSEVFVLRLRTIDYIPQRLLPVTDLLICFDLAGVLILFVDIDLYHREISSTSALAL